MIERVSTFEPERDNQVWGLSVGNVLVLRDLGNIWSVGVAHVKWEERKESKSLHVRIMMPVETDNAYNSNCSHLKIALYQSCHLEVMLLQLGKYNVNNHQCVFCTIHKNLWNKRLAQEVFSCPVITGPLVLTLKQGHYSLPLIWSGLHGTSYQLDLSRHQISSLRRKYGSSHISIVILPSLLEPCISWLWFYSPMIMKEGSSSNAFKPADV